MNAPTEMPSPIAISASAAERVRVLITEESAGDASLSIMLRVFVSGGGCSGFQYGFAFENESNDDDSVIAQEGFKVLIDSMSYGYLAGASIDYVEDLEGARFVIENPNASTTCGCGSSFSV